MRVTAAHEEEGDVLGGGVERLDVHRLAELTLLGGTRHLAVSAEHSSQFKNIFFAEM